MCTNRHACFCYVADLHESGAISFVVFDPNLVDVWGEYEIPCANVAVAAPSVAEAKQRLLAICHEHDIETPEYKVSNFVKYFWSKRIASL